MVYKFGENDTSLKKLCQRKPTALDQFYMEKNRISMYKIKIHTSLNEHVFAILPQIGQGNHAFILY